MLRRLAFIGAAIFAASPASADWIEIATSTSGSVWSMDPARITTEGSRVHAWVKVDASRDATVKYRKAMVLFGLICDSQKTKVLSLVEYDSYGKVINSRTFSDSGYGDYGYDPATPESMAEDVLKLACATAGK